MRGVNFFIRNNAGEGEPSDEQGGAVGVAGIAADFADGLVEVVGAFDRDAEDVLDLREADDDRSGGREPDEHRMREEVDEESQAADAEHDVHDAHHERKQCSGGQIAARPLLHERRQRCGGEQGHDRNRPHGELA